MLGEAMALAPVVLMAAEISEDSLFEGKNTAPRLRVISSLQSRFLRNGVRVEFGAKLIMVEWSQQNCLSELTRKPGKWTVEYERRNTPRVGFSHQDNKANLIANWLLAMFDATAKPVYRERAEKWFQVMKSRMKLKHDGTYVIWNYWEPAGAWDYKSDGLPKHWIGVRPNAA